MLMPLFNKSKLIEGCHDIRQFVLQHLVEPRQALRQKVQSQSAALDENNNNSSSSIYSDDEVPNDLLNSFLDFAEQSEDLSWQKILISFEDMLGGHSAIADFSVRALRYVAKYPEVQRRIREEVNAAGSVTMMSDKLRYTQATIWEVLRFASSGIVPHVATQDTTIDGELSI
jgi:cytochrome P450